MPPERCEIIMPRYKGSCGCYNRHDAREIGLIPAIVWNDILDRSEHLDINPMWYDQKDAADRLGIPERSMYRAVEKLMEVGRITKKKGYRPGTTVTTTWITIVEDPDSVEQNTQNGEPGTTLLAVPRNCDLAVPILKETNTNDTNSAGTAKDEVFVLNPATVLSALKRIFKQAGYPTIGGKALRDKANTFVADIKDSELTLDIIIDSAKAYLENDYYSNKSLMNFMNAKVFAYNVGKKKEEQEDEGIIKYGY